MSDEEIVKLFFTEIMDTSDDDLSDDDTEVLAATIVLHQAEQETIPRFRGSIVGHECLNRDRVAATGFREMPWESLGYLHFRNALQLSGC